MAAHLSSSEKEYGFYVILNTSLYKYSLGLNRTLADLHKKRAVVRNGVAFPD